MNFILVKDDTEASIRSLAGSTATSRPGTPSTSIGMSAPPESPQSTASRGRKVSRQVSGMDKTSQCSSMNFSIHYDESIEKMLIEKAEDSFHLPTHTLISPLVQPVAPVSTSQKMSVSGRFTVSPAQSIPMSVSFKQKLGTRTPTKSESSCGHSIPEPEMQFKMSDTSLHVTHVDEKAQNAEQKKPLLPDAIELGCKFHSIINILVSLYKVFQLHFIY